MDILEFFDIVHVAQQHQIIESFRLEKPLRSSNPTTDVLSLQSLVCQLGKDLSDSTLFLIFPFGFSPFVLTKKAIVKSSGKKKMLYH